MGKNVKLSRLRLTLEGYDTVTVRAFHGDGIGVSFPNENEFEEDTQGNSIPGYHPGVRNADIDVSLPLNTPKEIIESVETMYDLAVDLGLPLTIEGEEGGGMGFTRESKKGYFATPVQTPTIGTGTGIPKFAFKLRADNFKFKKINQVGRTVDTLNKLRNI